MKKLAILLIFPALLLLWWAASKRDSAQVVRFAKVTRHTIQSTIPTNGKVEPVEWATARAVTSGVVDSILTQRGQRVNSGQTLVTIDGADAKAALDSSSARIQQLKVELSVQAGGGRSVDLAEIENNLKAAKLQEDIAARNVDSLKRLVASQAATKLELSTAEDTLAKAKILVETYEARRRTLVSSADRTITEAKLQDAEAAADLARHHLAIDAIKAPIAGTVYQFDLKQGAYLSPGDIVASIGQLDQVRVRVYVDEPELGRVELGDPVIITWEGRPDQKWQGKVDRLPTQIVPLGTRQVGEVLCLIDNPNQGLLPGTNINAEIISKVVKDALSIPKQSLRYESRGKGVYKLAGDQVVWQEVRVGVSDVNEIQILSGLAEGDEVALPGDTEVNEGRRVKAILQ
ncbi:MAG: efflux RND transporter periplasmic adaptor subunit [Bryobacteraceae bacterium]